MHDTDTSVFATHLPDVNIDLLQIFLFFLRNSDKASPSLPLFPSLDMLLLFSLQVVSDSL